MNAEVATRREKEMQAYELWQRGRALLHVHTKENNILARALFIGAIQLDDKFARAYGHLSYTYVRAYMYGWDEQGVDAQAIALKLADKASDLDSKDYDNYWSRGVARLWNNRFQDAVNEYAEARVRQPLDPDLLASMSDALVANGQANEAVEQTQLAMALNSRHPPWYGWNLGLAYFVLGKYDCAIHCLLPIVGQINAARIHLAASYASRNRPPNPELGDPGDLVREKEEITRLREIQPNWTLDVALRQPLQPGDQAKLKAVLQKAGLT